MDEAVEIIITGTKLQNIQTILSFFISGTNSFFYYIISVLFKKPTSNDNYQVYNNETKNNTSDYLSNIKYNNIYIDENI